MVYVYSKLSELNNYIGKKLKVDQIEQTLKDLGMDVKGISKEKDPELKIELTAEKLDMISTIGIARAVKYYLGIEKKIPEYKISKSNKKIIVKSSVKNIRAKTVAAILKNVPMTEGFLEEIIKIQEKIHDSFGRNRKKAAIGIYPLNKIKFPVYYTAEKPKNIKFRPLESETSICGEHILEHHETGKKFAHLLKGNDLYPVFRDSNKKVLSMPPIINSHETGRVETHHNDLFIECTGHNLTHLDNILKVLVTTFIEMGAKAQSVKVEYSKKDVYELNLKNHIDDIKLDYINSLIGTNIKEKEISKYLSKVMIGLNSSKNGNLKIEIPCFRSDIWSDCDIADDIARGYGYNNIIPTYPNISTIGKTLDKSDFKKRITDTLVSLGFLETYTYMLTSTTIQYDKMLLDKKKLNFVKLIDSEDQGLNMIRDLILPETLQTLHINRKNKYPQKIFENGFTIQDDDTQETKARDESHLCVAIADPTSNYTVIKSILDSVLKLNEIDFKIRENKRKYLIEGRTANIFVKGQFVGFIGEVHPQVLSNFGLLVPVSTFELDLDKIFELTNN